MSTDPEKSKLLERVKHGRKITWQEYGLVAFIGLLTTGIFDAITQVFMGSGNAKLIEDGMVLLFIFTISIVFISYVHFNQRFSDLVELIGQEQKSPLQE